MLELTPLNRQEDKEEMAIVGDVMGERRERTGPVGRLARLAWLGVFMASLLSIVGREGSARFRNPHILGEPSAWFLHLAMVAVFVVVVGVLASSLAGPAKAGQWQIGALIAVAILFAAGAGIGLLLHGSAWGFPLADMVWWFDVVVLVEQAAATSLAIVIGTPGCEVGVWPELIGRARADGALPRQALACVIGLHFIDRWESHRRE